MSNNTQTIKVEDFYKTTITSSIRASWDVSFTVWTAPVNTKWWIIVNPESISLRERMYYHDVVWNTIYVKWINRYSPQAHTSSAGIQINDTSLIFNHLSDLSSTTFFVEKTWWLTATIWGWPVLKNWQTISIDDTLVTFTQSSTNYVYYTSSDDLVHITTNLTTAQTGVITAEVDTDSTIITDIRYRNYKFNILETYVWPQWPQGEIWPIWPQWPAWTNGTNWTNWTNGTDWLDITWKWEYNWATAYVINDAISYLWKSYICKLASTWNLPTNTTYFDVMLDVVTSPLSWYTTTNYTTDRVIDMSNTTLNELWDLVSTLINDITVLSTSWTNLPWGTSINGSTDYWLTLQTNTWASTALKLEAVTTSSANLEIRDSFIWSDETSSWIRFYRKRDDGTNMTVWIILPYTPIRTSWVDTNSWFAIWTQLNWSTSYRYWFDWFWRFTLWWLPDITIWWTNSINFSSWTAPTITWNTIWALYNNSGTLTWVNSWADNQFALNIPNNSSSVVWQTITIWNTQTNTQTWLYYSSWTSTLDHTSLSLNWTRHSIYIWNSDQAPATTTNRLYAVGWNLYWNWTLIA